MLPDVALGNDLEGTHHVVGFVFEDVAVVEVFAGVAFEADDNACDHAARALDGVLPTCFICFGRDDGAGEMKFLVHEVLGGVEGAAIEDLKAHHVQMHGMNIFGEVDELPDFGGVEFRELGGGFVPVLAVDQHDHGPGGFILIFVEGERTGFDCFRFGNSLDGTNGFRDGMRW